MEEIFGGRIFYPLSRNGKVVYTSRVFANKYIFVFGEGPMDICKFEDIHWKCIQARNLSDDWVSREYDMKMKEVGLNFKNVKDVYFENGMVCKKEGVIIGMEYKGLFFDILLLNDPKQISSSYQYGKKTSLIKAITTFQCVITRI